MLTESQRRDFKLRILYKECLHTTLLISSRLAFERNVFTQDDRQVFAKLVQTQDAFRKALFFVYVKLDCYDISKLIV